MTGLPDSKLISATIPGISALIMAPCTGEMEPTALKIGCQSACLTIALVTVVGGGTIFLPAEIIVQNLQSLDPGEREKQADETEHDPEDRALLAAFLGADEAELAAVVGKEV